MKDEITIREFRDISSIRPNTAACVTSRGNKVLTFHGEDPHRRNYLRVTDASGNLFYVHKAKLGNLLMGRKA